MMGAKSKATAKLTMRLYIKKYDRWFDTPQQLKRYEFYRRLKQWLTFSQT